MAHTPLWLAAIGAILKHTKRNDMTSNPYVAQILAQGKEPSKAPAPKRQFPCTIGARRFETEAEYQEALADFLNGM